MNEMAITLGLLRKEFPDWVWKARRGFASRWRYHGHKRGHPGTNYDVAIYKSGMPVKPGESSWKALAKGEVVDFPVWVARQKKSKKGKGLD